MNLFLKIGLAFSMFLVAPILLAAESKPTILLLESESTPKRLKMEVTDLLTHNDMVVELLSSDSKTHPFEIKITFVDNKIEYLLSCKIPQNFPFNAPMLAFQTKGDLFEPKELAQIKKGINEELSMLWSPAVRMTKVIEIVKTKINSYNENKIALQKISLGEIRTIAQLKEKYASDKIYAGKYPEFQKKLQGFWAKETSTGYLVFHIDADGTNIKIAFEPKYSGAPTILYQGNYAAGYYVSNSNKFDIHTSDINEVEKTPHHFQIAVYDDSISLMFASLNSESILDRIISKLEMRDVIGECIYFMKM